MVQLPQSNMRYDPSQTLRISVGEGDGDEGNGKGDGEGEGPEIETDTEGEEEEELLLDVDEGAQRVVRDMLLRFSQWRVNLDTVCIHTACLVSSITI
jgi:hypothetical protein